MGVKKYTARGRTFWKTDFRVRTPDGKYHRIIKRKIPTREMAIALEAKIQSEIFEGIYFEKRRKQSSTVNRLWKDYEKITRRDNDSWQSDTGRALHLLRHLGKHQVDNLSLRVIDEYRFKRANETTKTTGAPPRTSSVNREVSLLKRIINYAVKCGEVKSNPIAHVKLLPESNVRQTVIDEEQFERLFENAEAPLPPILLLAFDCGMRKREILDLRWNQLDLHEGVIRLAPEDTKTDQARVIHMTDRTIASLNKLPRAITGYVLPNPKTGEPWVDIRKLFKRGCTKAGIKHGRENGIIFHDLRRSFVTNARKRGIPESVIMKMSGHKTRSIFDRYNVIDETDLKAAVKQLEQARERELNNNQQKTAEREA